MHPTRDEYRLRNLRTNAISYHTLMRAQAATVVEIGWELWAWRVCKPAVEAAWVRASASARCEQLNMLPGGQELRATCRTVWPIMVVNSADIKRDQWFGNVGCQLRCDFLAGGIEKPAALHRMVRSESHRAWRSDHKLSDFSCGSEFTVDTNPVTRQEYAPKRKSPLSHPTVCAAAASPSQRDKGARQLPQARAWQSFP